MEDQEDASALNHINFEDDVNKSENSMNNPDFTPFIREGNNKYLEELKYINEDEAASPAKWKPPVEKPRPKAPTNPSEACGRAMLRTIFLIIELGAFCGVIAFYIYRMVISTVITYRFVYFYNYERDEDISYTVKETLQMRAILAKVTNVTNMSVPMLLSEDNVSYDFNKYIDCKGRMDIFPNRTMADKVNKYISGLSTKLGVSCILGISIILCILKIVIAVTVQKNEVPFIFKRMVKSRWMFENMIQFAINVLVISILYLPIPLHSFDNDKNCLVGRIGHTVYTMYQMFYSGFVSIMFTGVPMLFFLLYNDNKILGYCIFIVLICLLPAFLYIIGLGNYVAIKVILSYYSEPIFVKIFYGLYGVLGLSFLVNIIYGIHSNIMSKKLRKENELSQIKLKEAAS